MRSVIIDDNRVSGIPRDYTERIFKYRQCVRAILIGDHNKIGMLYIKQHEMYTLPGGGIDFPENQLIALKREVKEETGCTIKENPTKLITIQEISYRKSRELGKIQLNYFYVCRLDEQHTPYLTENEINLGYEFLWLEITSAIELFKKRHEKKYDKYDEYIDSFKFSSLRDQIALEEYFLNL